MKQEIIFNILLIIIIVIGAMILRKIDNDFIKDCTEAGNSYEYCERVK